MLPLTRILVVDTASLTVILQLRMILKPGKIPCCIEKELLLQAPTSMTPIATSRFRMVASMDCSPISRRDAHTGGLDRNGIANWSSRTVFSNDLGIIDKVPDTLKADVFALITDYCARIKPKLIKPITFSYQQYLADLR